MSEDKIYPTMVIRSQAEAIELLQKENKHLNLQLDQALKDYDELQERIDKAIEEINYMITNVDITEISAIKLKQILGDKENE